MNSAKTAVKLHFSKFGSDHARVLVLGHNDFSCGVNDLKNYILPPLVVYPAKKAVKPPFSNFGSDQAKVLVFGHNNFLSGTNNLRSPTCSPLSSAETVVKLLIKYQKSFPMVRWYLELG